MSNTTDTASRRPVFEWAVDETSMRQQIAALEWNYYVYALCDDTGAAFYIGKGRGARLFQHAKDAAAGEQGAKYDQIRALGRGMRFALLLACRDDAYALGFEALLIRQHFDSLTNEANGSAAAIVCMDREPVIDSPLGLLLQALVMAAKEQVRIRERAETLVRQHPELRERLAPVLV